MTAGAVLCGGSSRRMGRDKALVEVAGLPMAERVARALSAGGCAPVVLVGGDAALLARLGRPVVPDRFPGEGPAGGVLTALGALADEVVVVASCDLPLLDAATVAALVRALDADDAADVAVAVTDRWQLSLTCWRRRAHARLVARWDAGGRSLHDLVHAVRHVDVAVPADRVRNVNTVAELSGAAEVAGYIGAVAVQEIDVEQLAERMAAGARVVDVREPDEYESGHVPGAVLVPLGTVPDHLEAFSGDGPTYVICKSGARSMRACEYVAEQVEGAEVVNVAGGTMAWIASGRDTVGGDRPS